MQSNSPSQIITFNALAVTIARFCLIQFYVQLRQPLVEHRVLLKIVAIKLVVFLSFWQASAISIGTSTLNIVQPNKVLAWPDLKVGVPALLLCIEMACFAILHLWAFPYKPYVPDAPVSFYPNPDPDKPVPQRVNERSSPSGGPLGLLAIVDALNLWDFVKAFGRGMRWLVCGVKRRKEDISYKLNHSEALDIETLPDAKGAVTTYSAMRPAPGFGTPAPSPGPRPQLAASSPHPGLRHDSLAQASSVEESAGLMDYAQPHAETSSYGAHAARQQPTRPARRPSAQAKVGEALWGPK